MLQAKRIIYKNGKEYYYDLHTGKLDRSSTFINNHPNISILIMILICLFAGYITSNI